MGSEKPIVLVVEDDEMLRETIIEILSVLNVTLIGCEDGARGLEMISALKPLVVLSDIMMPKMTGIEMLQELVNQQYEYPVIILTAYADQKKTVYALRLGAYDFLSKPFHSDELVEIIGEAIEFGMKVKEFDKYWNELAASNPEINNIHKELMKHKREMAKMKFMNRKKVA